MIEDGETHGVDRSGGPFRPVRSLRFWLIAAALLALLAVSTGAVATYAARRLVQSSATVLVERLRPAQSAQQRLVTAYVDEETGQRGFVLTHNESYLDPYRSGKKRVRVLQQQLAEQLTGQREALLLLAEVKTAGSDWRAHVAQDNAAVRAGRDAAVHTDGRQRQEKRLFDLVRGRLDDLGAEVDRLVGDQLERQQEAQQRLEVAMAVAVVLSLLAVGATVGLVHFALTRPLGRLQAQLRSVAGGEYDRRIDATGPEEVSNIAEAAETMRMSIIDRASELVAAQHELSVQTERQRVAADLHDTTIQRIFGLGLKLSAVASQRVELAGTLNSLIDEADEIIRELRRMIFAMNGDEVRAGRQAAPDPREPQEPQESRRAEPSETTFPPGQA